MRAKRSLFLLLAVAIGLAAAAVAVAARSQDEQPPRALIRTVRRALRSQPRLHAVRSASPRLIRSYRRETWRWETLMGLPRTRGSRRPTVPVLRFWLRHAARARRTAFHPPHLAAWLCIHRYEGAWSDGGDPYWGGLQMDRGFMLRYAPASLLRRGWANAWSPIEQMWVAERALRSGVSFSAWPNSSRMCGIR